MSNHLDVSLGPRSPNAGDAGAPARRPRPLDRRCGGGVGPVVALLASGLAACAGAPRRGAASDACVVVPRAAAAPDVVASDVASVERSGRVSMTDPDRAVVVGIPGPVDPAHAPVPRTAAERLVFAQLYQTVVRVTCEGSVEPVVASSWRMDDEGRRWTFTLRPDVRDWDGVPVTAADVAASWVAAREALVRDPAPGPPPGFVSVVVVDPRTLLVELAGPATIAFFAHPELAVRTSTATAGWPNGSGPYRPQRDPGPDAGPLASLGLVRRGEGTGLEFRTVPRDARNALDSGVDLLVTAEPAVIDYASSSTDFLTFPLTWDRSYLLVARPPGGSPEPDDAKPGRLIVRPPEAALAALARDAVRVQARPARGPFGEGDACGRAPASTTSSASPASPADPGASRSERAAPEPREQVAGGAGWTAGRDRRIVYPLGDAVARSLAERLVALALDPRRPDAGWLAQAVPELTRAGGRVRTAGLPAQVFADALRAGTDVVYVVPIERGARTDLCDAVVAMLGRAPRPDRAARAREGRVTRIVPLVETRSTLVIRRGIDGVAVDGRGALLLDDLRRAAAERERSENERERGGTAEHEGGGMAERERGAAERGSAAERERRAPALVGAAAPSRRAPPPRA